MAQSTDFVVDDGTGASLLAQLNTMMAALASSHSGPTAPPSPVAGQPWLDTGVSPAVWRVRNAAGNAWIALAPETIAPGTVWGNLGGSAAFPTANTIAALITALGFSQVTGSPRRLIFPGGMRIQGGTGTTGASGSSVLTFPLAFNTSPTFLAVASTTGGGGFVSWNNIGAAAVTVAGWTSNSQTANLTYSWLAFGE